MSKLAEYSKFLSIDKHAMDVCLLEQPELFYKTASEYVRACSLRDAAKLALDEMLADLDQSVRAEAARKEEKLTEAGLQNRLRTFPKVQDAQQDYLDKRQAADEWLALKEAFQQRSFMLRELVALYIAQRQDLGVEAGAGQARLSLAESNRAAANDKRRRLRA